MLSGKILPLILSWIAGGMLGAIFFGGLWWTIRKGLASRRPARWFLGSLLLRTSVVVVGIYYVYGGRPERILACLAGIVVARLVVTRLAAGNADAQSRHDRGISCV